MSVLTLFLLEFPCKKRRLWIWTASSSAFSNIFLVQFHFHCISVKKFTNTHFKTWFDTLIFHTSFLKLQYFSAFPVKLDIYRDSTTQKYLYCHVFFKTRTRFTLWMVSHIIKHFLVIFPLLLFPSVSWLVFPTAIDESKGSPQEGSIVKYIFILKLIF